MSRLIIGIDPGTNTGFAVSENGKLTRVESMRIDEALSVVLLDMKIEGDTYQNYIKVYLEDARKSGREHRGQDAAQGAGSVKRDCNIWEDFLKAHKIDYVLVSPQSQRKLNKMSAGKFKAMTGWQGRTNEHGRDAAMLVWGR